MSLAHHTLHYPSNGKGWKLELKQCRPPKNLVKKRRPVVIIPGYGMNSFIFGFHPRGLSMEEFFTLQGLEVWSVNLRDQGGSMRDGGSKKYNLQDLALTDLKTAIDYILKKSESKATKVDLIGCSLGGTLSYIYASLAKKKKVNSIVAIGAPMRWEEVHPIVKLLTLSPKLAGFIPIFGTKEFIKTFSSTLGKTSLLNFYIHPEMVDIRHAHLLLETVEDPSRYINEEISKWIQSKDLQINGHNLTQELKKAKNPLLCVLANADGMVPPMTALSAHSVIGSKVKETLVVGTDKLRFAHADLFVSNHCHEMVFKPIAKWLLKQYQS